MQCNIHNTSNTNGSLQKLAQCVYAVSTLPCAPTADWPTLAADALSKLAPNAAFAVIIARLHTESLKASTDASGVSSNTNHPATANPFESRSTLEQLGSLNPKLHHFGLSQALISSAQILLPKWYASDASNHWKSTRPQQTLVSYYPLINAQSDENSAQNQQLALICIAAPNPNSADLLDHDMFSSVMSILNHKAAAMCNEQFNNSICWLTQREQVILDQLIVGCSVREIADSIDRSPHTVHDHVKSLHKKLNASSRGQLIAKALGHQDHSSQSQLNSPQIDPELLHQTSSSEFIELHPEARVRAMRLNR